MRQEGMHGMLLCITSNQWTLMRTPDLDNPFFTLCRGGRGRCTRYGVFRLDGKRLSGLNTGWEASANVDLDLLSIHHVSSEPIGAMTDAISTLPTATFPAEFPLLAVDDL